MYVASWIFLLAAIGSLAFGLSQPGLTFIYVSIGASVVAMLFLLAGVLRKRPVEPATAGAPYGPTPEEAAAAEPTPAVATRPAARQAARRPEEGPQRKPALAEAPAAEGRAAADATAAESRAAAEATAAEAKEAPAPAPARKTTARKTAAKKTAAKAGAAKTTTRKTAARAGAEVVAIPERGTYHQATCRFVRGRRDTEKLNKTTARRRGYNACGVCKPDAA